MDPLSQGAVGAAVAVALAGPERVRWAAGLGALSGMAPDLDVLVRSSNDPLLFLEYHRQFSHSLVFIPFGALLCALLALPVTRRRLDFRWNYALCLAGYATHGLLDGCTSYGTQLLWPFSDVRVAWSLIAVVDPIFTAPLVALVIGAAIKRAPKFARVACLVASLYLLLGYTQHERAQAFGREVARTRGQGEVLAEAKPSFGNLLLWKTWYVHGDRVFVDAVRLGLRPVAFPGESIALLDRDRDLPWLDLESEQARDIERFRWFSSEMIALDPANGRRIIDVRYSLLPNRIEGLWGIELDDQAGPTDHAAFTTSRRPTKAHRAELRRMLLGSTPEPD